MNQQQTSGRGQLRVLLLRWSPALTRSKTTVLLGVCVLTGALISTALGFFAFHVEVALKQDISRSLGAPLVLRSDRPLVLSPPSTVAYTRTATFTTGAIGPGGYQTISLKAVAGGYPLKDRLVVDPSPPSARTAPNVGSGWFDRRALDLLGAAIGDNVQIGRLTVTVARELVFEPDRLTQLQHTLPRVIIGIDDLEVTGLDLESGRGEFRYLFAGPPGAIKTWSEELGRQVGGMRADGPELLTPQSGSHPLARMTQRASRFLGMISTLALVLCGCAAGILTEHLVRRYRGPAATLRCLGADIRVVMAALLASIVAIAVAGALVGGLLGWLLSPHLLGLLGDYLKPFEPQWSARPFLIAVLTSAAITLAFALPRIIALGKLQPTEALRSTVGGLRHGRWSWLIGALALVLPLTAYSDNWQLTLILTGGLALVVLLTLVMGWMLSKIVALAGRISSGWRKAALRFAGRDAVGNLLPMATIAVATMALLITAGLRTGFLDTYHGQRFAHDGNYLFTGLRASEQGAFESSVAASGGTVRGMYPVVEAKLVAINGEPLESALSRESDTREEARSKVRLSFADQLPTNNSLLSGVWPSAESPGVSVDSEVMSDFGLEIGDRLAFQIGVDPLEAPIVGSRGFKGGGSSTMFWFMFAPETLAPFDVGFMGGLSLEGEARDALGDLNHAFPQVRIISLTEHLDRLRSIMTALTRTLDTLIVLIAAAALLVVFAAAYSSVERHRRRAAVMRAFGLTRFRLLKMLALERIVLGVLAGMTGIVGAKLVLGLMFEYQFALPYRFEANLLIAVPLLGALGFVMLGLPFVRSLLKRSNILSMEA